MDQSPTDTIIDSDAIAPSEIVHTKKKRNLFLFSLFILVLIAIVFAGYLVLHSRSTKASLSSYFTYSETERSSLKNLSSSQRISADDVYQYDQIAFDLVAKNTTREDFTEEVSKIYAYLTVAERDVASLSYSSNGSFSGSIGPVSKQVLCIYFKDDCETIPSVGTEDAYTTAITALVMSKVEARMREDAAGLTPYPIKTGKEYWDGPQPSIGITNGHSKGWFITSGDEFRAPPPPAFTSKEFADQLQITKDALRNATPEEKRATVFWAGGPGTKTPPGQILTLGDEYMKEKGTPLSKLLLVRSVLSMAVADAVTAVFDSKYTYFVRRPFMMDPSIVTIMPTPNHPSYPAGHSTLSAAGATVLEHYFPENTVFWQAKAEEAGMSRIWGGIHYLMDNDAGVVIGTKVGEAAIAGTPEAP